MSIAEPLDSFARARAAAGDAQAVALYREVLSRTPQQAEALRRLGLLAARAGRRDEAIALFGELGRLRPDDTVPLYNSAILLRQNGRPDAALAMLRRLLALAPDHADGLGQQALALDAAGRRDAARMVLRRLLRLQPERSAAAKQLGVLLLGAGRAAEAEAVYRRAAAASPGDGELWFNLGVAAERQGRRDDAIAALRRAMQLLPQEQAPARKLAGLLLAAGRPREAAPVLQALLERVPDDAWATTTLAGVHKAQGDKARAIALFRRAAAAQPQLGNASLGLCLSHLPMVYADEAEMAASREEYARALRRLAEAWPATPPAPLLEEAAQAVCAFQPYYLPYQARCDRDLQEVYGGLMHRVMAAAHPQWCRPLEKRPPAAGEPLRVGIVSGFFRWHTIWKLFLRGWMSGLDRDRLHLTAYSTDTVRDATTAEARAGFARFVELPGFEAMAERIRADAPHVLIWPEVGMNNMAAKLACLRLAPVQCVSWGHPDTTGLPTMDWFLTSDLMEPEGGEACYSERVERLPGLGIRYEALTVPVTPTDFTAFGIRPDAVLYLCCQYLPKYLPRYDRLLARIAARVPGAQFAFISLRKPLLEKTLRQRLAAAFAEEGLDAERHVVFLPYLQPGQYAALNDRAAIYLDTIGWSGGNTTLEAVAHGLPVVTLPGDLMRGRHSAAILRQIGVPDTIAADQDDYVALAARLAADTAWRAEIARRVAAGQARIYDDERPLRALEDFLERVMRSGD